MSPKLDENALDILFRTARTHNTWQAKPVSDELLQEIYDVFKFGPTSANGSPARILFLKSEEAKARLLPALGPMNVEKSRTPALGPMNVEKSRTAPVVAVIAFDLEFYEKLPKLFPHADAKPWFANNPELAFETAFRNSSLQGAYFMIAARALGLDCGPMSGFNAEKLNAEFFPDGKWKVNFICNLGYGNHADLFPRNPRLDFEEACTIL
jgi:3-hydroxypropanoate dehydrogenase